MSIVDQLSSGRFEFGLSIVQSVYYRLEREVGHALLRRPPPASTEPHLLNLGCGPHIFQGWVNADDYGMKRWLREKNFKPNWMLDITRAWRCPTAYWDGIFSEHVVEHLTYSEAVHTFRECFRTLKPGGRIRISVPDLRTYVDYYVHPAARSEWPEFPKPAIALSFLSQMHLHKSIWDAELMISVLDEIGFADCRQERFGRGADPRLVRDDPDKAHESLYVEGRKP